jgi:hypothetical protein
MKQLRFNVRDAYARVTGSVTPSSGEYRSGFYDGYMARCADQQRLTSAQRAVSKKKRK